MILTLANNFNEWTYFEPTRLIHRWTTLVQLTRRYALATSRINKIGDCAEVTFDWRYVMTTAVERKHQKRRSITFLCNLCYKTYTKPSQRMNENDVKIRDEFDFSVVHRSMNAKLTWHPGRHLLCTRLIASLLQCYVLPRTQFYVTWKSETQSEKHRQHFDSMHSDMSECRLLFFVHCIGTYWQDTTSGNLFYLCVKFLTNIIWNIQDIQHSI